MIKFFLNKKFWVPIVLLLVLVLLLEIFFRMGLWDSRIKPHSFLGNAKYRVQALNEFGLQKINWITAGDSKTDWGVNHGDILRAQQQNGENHLRMSFESSGFMAIQATIEWSIAHMPNLKGVMLGVTEDNFGHLSDATKQYNVAWPFRDYFDYDKYSYFTQRHQQMSFFSRQAVHVYFKDFRDYINNMPTRKRRLERFVERGYRGIFTYNINLRQDLCTYELKTMSQCIDAAKSIKSKGGQLSGAENFIRNQCGNDMMRYRMENNLGTHKIKNKTQQKLIANWKKLFDSILAHNIKLQIVMLPEQAMFDYSIKPANTIKVVNAVLSNYIDNPQFKVVDLRELFDDHKNGKQCHFFNDPLHYNHNGKAVITQEIIKSFGNNRINKLKTDKLTQFNFE
jgi:hypothetical protein